MVITCMAAAQWKKDAGENASAILRLYSRTPVFVALFLIDALAFISILFSPDMEYSTRVFLDEFLLNTCLFTGVALLSSTGNRCPFYWKRGLATADIVFLSAYIGLMAQWVLFPAHPLFVRQEPDIFTQDIGAIIFGFGNHSLVFQGIHHISLFLGLMIAFWSSLPERTPWKNFLFLVLNFFTLVTTTRRAAAIASVFGVLFGLRQNGKDLRPVLMLVAASISGILLILAMTHTSRYFIREDWKLILRGNVEKAKQLGGSIPLRISTYREFSRQIAEHPFTPQGIGKKLIKEYHQDLVKKAGLQHGHNTLLNFAFYMGIQGALALAAFIAIQARLFWKAYRAIRTGPDEKLMLTGLTFLIIFWGTNMFTDGFLHGSATLYWLFTAIPTGVALRQTHHTE